MNWVTENLTIGNIIFNNHCYLGIESMTTFIIFWLLLQNENRFLYYLTKNKTITTIRRTLSALKISGTQSVFHRHTRDYRQFI